MLLGDGDARIYGGRVYHLVLEERGKGGSTLKVHKRSKDPEDLTPPVG